MRARLDFRDRERGGPGSFIGRAVASHTESVNSLQLGDLKDQFSGSTGSLPSIGASSVSELSPTPTPEPPNTDEDSPIIIMRGSQEACVGDEHNTAQKEEQSNVPANSEPTTSSETQTAAEIEADPVGVVANRLVQQTLTTVVTKLEEEQK